MKIKILLISFLIFYLPQYLIGQKSSLEKGIVSFIYEKDSLQRYWLIKTLFQVKEKIYCLVPSADDIVVQLEVGCNGADTIISYKEPNPVSIYNAKQFQDTNQITELQYRLNYFLHKGGDIYAINDSLIEIIFHIKAYITKINREPCERFSYGGRHYCLLGFKSFYPMAVILDILETKSLTKREIRMQKIKKIKKDNFKEGFCY